MPALGTSLVVRDTNQEILHSTELWWWQPRNLTKDPRFTRVDSNGYTDWFAQLTLKEFVDMNRGQIEQQDKYFVLTHAEQIQHISSLIRSGEWDDAILHVTLYEWESGLS